MEIIETQLAHGHLNTWNGMDWKSRHRMPMYEEIRFEPRLIQRLNQAEYAAAVRDLLGIEVDVSAFLPLDTKSANFDNIADVQMPSATVIEGYLRAAGQISRLALGDPEAEVRNTIYRMPRVASQNR